MIHFRILNSSQKASKCTVKIGPRTDDEFLLYVNEKLPGKIINSYKVKEKLLYVIIMSRMCFRVNPHCIVT